MIRHLRSLSTTLQFMVGLVISTLVSVGFFIYGSYRDDNLAFEYLLWNLLLAWIPFGLTLLLLKVLQRNRWSSWQGLSITLLWLIFLPNTFYMVSDFIHLQDVASGDVLYDAVMLTSFIFTSLMLGFASLFLVHRQLLRRVPPLHAALWVGLILLICSFAIYIGRDLRWNSWDVFTSPAGLLFDVSARFIYASNYSQLFLVVSSFFALITSMYSLLWRGAKLLSQNTHI